MRNFIGDLFYVSLVLAWIFGAVLAHGFWSTLSASVVPPYAWYLVVEWAAHRWGLL